MEGVSISLFFFFFISDSMLRRGRRFATHTKRVHKTVDWKDFTQHLYLNLNWNCYVVSVTWKQRHDTIVPCSSTKVIFTLDLFPAPLTVPGNKLYFDALKRNYTIFIIAVTKKKNVPSYWLTILTMDPWHSDETNWKSRNMYAVI